MAYRIVTMIQCPRCNRTLGSADRGYFVNQFKVGSPVWPCTKCNKDVLIPSHISVRDDEWEMKPAEFRTEVLSKLEKEAPVSSDERYWVGGCLGILVVPIVLGIAIGFGARAIFENKPLLKGAFGAGVAVFIAISLLWPRYEKRRARKQHIREVELLITRIEESRKRMANPEYRERLRSCGLPARGIGESAEPPEVAQFVAVLKAKVESLKAASVT